MSNIRDKIAMCSSNIYRSTDVIVLTNVRVTRSRANADRVGRQVDSLPIVDDYYTDDAPVLWADHKS